jgi:hypothetical protein
VDCDGAEGDQSHDRRRAAGERPGGQSRRPDSRQKRGTGTAKNGETGDKGRADGFVGVRSDLLAPRTRRVNLS